MSIKRTYTFLTLTILAIFALLVLWPGFVITTYVKLRTAVIPMPIERQRTQDDFVSSILSSINFSPSTTTSTSTIGLKPNDTADNHLIIPSIGVNGEVIISDSQSALNRGFWHIPGSALPTTNGNIVISSHRWLHVPPNPVTFYRIDEIRIGDLIYYNYQGRQYTYTVTETKIVEPTDVHILEQDENKLTLFTCHPLFSTALRYVVIAKLSSVDDSIGTQ